MFKYFYLITSFILFISCELKDYYVMDISDSSSDSILVPMDSIKEKPIFAINSFSNIPDSMSDCSCKFSLTKNIFRDNQFIYAGNVSSEKDVSYMQFRGDWVQFALDSLEITIDDSLKISVMNDSLSVKIRAVKDSSLFNFTPYRGELQIYNKEKGKDFISNIFGACQLND